MSGYTSKSIRVDLTKREIEVFNTPEELCNNYIGGRGIGVAMIADRINLSYDSPKMPLIFASGPLVGTASPTSGRIAVVSKSPLTGTVFDCSAGGRFGTELKRAGYDLIEITGASEKPVLLKINNKQVSIEDASNISGKNISEIKNIFGDKGSIAAIGISGEKEVAFSAIAFDGHYLAGRGGLGAVMGSKNLKAIHVKGDGKISVADPVGLKGAREDIMRLLRASQAVFGELGLSEFGTSALVDLIHARRMEPTGNFRKTFFQEAGNYSGYTMKSFYKAKKAMPILII